MWRGRQRAGAYAVAVGVSAGYRVGLVEQAVADLACEVLTQAVEVGSQDLELLLGWGG